METLGIALPPVAGIFKTWLWLGGEVMPRTAGQWGAVALVAAFVLLAAGAGLSLRRGRGAGEELRRDG